MALATINGGTGDTTVVAAVAGKKVRVKSLTLFNGNTTAANVFFKGSGGVALHAGLVALPAAIVNVGGIAADEVRGGFLFETLPGEGLVINASAAAAPGGLVSYSLE
jgi:hypothetical protein